jgi:hypothetical protein
VFVVWPSSLYRRERGPRCLIQKLNSEDGGHRSKRGHLRDPLACGDGTRPEAWPLRGDGSMNFSIPQKNQPTMLVCISSSFKLPQLLAFLGCCVLTFPSLALLG